MTGTPEPPARRAGPHRDYAAAHRIAQEEPERFWAAAVRAVSWIHRPAREPGGPLAGGGRRYRGGELNACFNALDRHVIAGRADQPALVVDAFGDGEPATHTYADLLDRVARFGGALQALGVRPGDRVLIELPARLETVVAMLACARIGAVHVLVDGDLSVPELATRIAAARPRVTIGPSSAPEDDWPRAGRSRLAEAIERAGHEPEQRIVVDRPPGDTDPVAGELDWSVLVRSGTVPPAPCLPVGSGHPLFLLYPDRDPGRRGQPAAEALAEDLADDLAEDDAVAGEDGEPGRPPRAHAPATGSYVVGLSAAMREVYGLGPGDVLAGIAALATPEGHLAAVYGPLLAGATSVLVDGAPSGDDDLADLAGLLARHRVDAVLAPPSGLAAVAAALANGEVARPRAVVLTGGPLNPDAPLRGLDDLTALGVPVVDDYAGALLGEAEVGADFTESADRENAPVTGNSPPPAAPGRSRFGWRRD